MKLLARYQRINILATVIVMLLSGVCFYFVIHYVLVEELDDALIEEEQEVVDYVKMNKNLPNPSRDKDQQVTFTLSANKIKRTFSTVNVYDSSQNENESTRQLLFPINVNGKMYDVSILKSQEETEDLIQLIVIITLGMVILLLAIIFILNRFLLRRLWKPFNSTLAQIKDINLSGKNTLQFEDTSVTEFRELNHSVSIMMNHLSEEFGALRNFTDNASHEMQTPLAIINSKLDLLLQDENITEQQINHLQIIYNALDKLSRLNQSLLLLTKIGNKQFNENRLVRVDVIIKEKLLQLEEMISNKKIVLEVYIQKVSINCNEELLEIMIGNMLNNAVRYNKEDGEIIIKLTKNELIIANSSVLPPLDKEKIFQRFYRHENTFQDGNGLGLSIIKQIGDSYGFDVQYYYQNNKHQFKINFPGILQAVS